MIVEFLLFATLSAAQVISANYKTFKEDVLDSPHVTMVKFYAPWCGHCKNLEPEYNSAASRLDGFARLVKVDCDNSINRELCSRYDVKGFPTVKIFVGGGIPTDYQGERKSKAIVDTLISMIPSRHVKRIGGKSKKAVSMVEFLQDESLQKVILVTDKKATSALFKALSIEYLGRLAFGELRKSESADIIDSLQITKFPTVLLYPKEKGSEPIAYGGSTKYAEMNAFLKSHAPEKQGKKKVDKKGKKTKPVKEKTKPKEPETKVDIIPFDDTIEELTCENCLQNKCLKKEGICAIAFLTLEKEFPESIATFEENIKIMQAIKKKYYDRNVKVNLVWTNAIDHGRKLINDFGVSDLFPSMIVFDPAKSHYRLLRMAFEQKAIQSMLDSFLAGSSRITYTTNVLLDKPPKKKETPAAKAEESGSDRSEL